jgi:hypothetical protein
VVEVGLVRVFGYVGGEIGGVVGVVRRVGGRHLEVYWRRLVRWSRVWRCKIYALLVCLGGAFGRLSGCQEVRICGLAS